MQPSMACMDLISSENFGVFFGFLFFLCTRVRTDKKQKAVNVAWDGKQGGVEWIALMVRPSGF